jgi:hypothetical protein
MVTNHGFLGALIHGHIRGRYLTINSFGRFSRLQKARRAHLSIRSAHHRRWKMRHGGSRRWCLKFWQPRGGVGMSILACVLRLILVAYSIAFQLQSSSPYGGIALETIWRANSSWGRRRVPEKACDRLLPPTFM